LRPLQAERRCGIAARPQHLLHARAGLAGPDDLHQGLADAQPRVLQRQQVDARDDEVAPQAGGVNRAAAREAGDDGEVLLLDQRHLARRQLGLAAPAQAVIRQADAGQRGRRLHVPGGVARRAAHDDGFDAALDVGRRRVEVADRLHCLTLAHDRLQRG